MIFWADTSQNVIRRQDLNGDEGRSEVIVQGRINNIESLAHDWISDTIYWVDPGNGVIEMSKVDGSMRRLLINESLDEPRGLALDPRNGYMYWTDWGVRARIERATLDGSSRTAIITEDIHWPNGITLDHGAQKLYWVDAYLDRIESAGTDGGHREVVLNQGVPHPYSIAVFKDTMYWDDWTYESILSADKQTGGSYVVVLDHILGLMDLKVYEKDSQTGSSACATHGSVCSHLCVNTPLGGYTCLCPDDVHRGPGSHGERCFCDPSERMSENGTCVTSGGGGCGAEEFRCDSDRCIPLGWQCDKDNDCGDSSDERSCDYSLCHPHSQFTCDNGKCIPSSWVCDVDDDCGDGSDEQGCPSVVCSTDQFQCANGRCIPAAWVCDIDNDCHDMSDELNCTVGVVTPPPPAGGCTADTQFRCGNGVCVSAAWVCDGDNDCGDMSDESDTCNVTCNIQMFTCANSRCIYTSWVCDNEDDCRDGSDETDDLCEVTTPEPRRTTEGYCGSDEFRCNTGHCVNLRWKCDGVYDCGDRSDEFDCERPPTPPPATSDPSQCPDDTWPCRNGKCTLLSWRCDGDNDCGDWSDEVSCDRSTTPSPPVSPAPCDPEYFTCGVAADVPCIPHRWVCDYADDCGDNSDEDDCPFHYRWNVTDQPTPLCTENMFTCRGSRECVNAAYVCNGLYDCIDGSDEDGCDDDDDTGPTDDDDDDCSDYYFPCSDRSGCISPTKLCDSHWNCLDGSDETASNCDLYHYEVQDFRVDVLNSTAANVRWFSPYPAPPDDFYYIVFFVSMVSGHEHSITVPSSRNSFTVTALSPYTLYQFTINVNVNNVSFTTNLPLARSTPEGIPSAPRNLRVHLLTNSSNIIEAEWSPPAEPNGIIQRYAVMYKCSSCSTWTSQNSQSNSTLIPGLQLDMEYTVKVWAMNGAGHSDPTEPVTVTMNHHTINEAPDQPKVLEIAETWVTVQWSPLSIVSNHQLLYKVTALNSMSSVATEPGLTARTWYNVTGLSPGISYTVVIQGHNIYGDGPPSAPVSVTTTGQTVPHVDNVTVVETGSTYVVLSWTVDDTSRNWVYGVYWDRHTIGSHPEWSIEQVTTQSIRVTGLQPGIQYLIAVRIIGPMGTGPMSDTILVMTAFNSSLAPRDFTVTPVDATHVNLSWRSPRDSPQLLGFRVYIQRSWLDETDMTLLMTLTDTYDTLNQVLVGDLVAGGTYSFQVSCDHDNAIPSDVKQIHMHSYSEPVLVKTFLMGNGSYLILWEDPVGPYIPDPGLDVGFTVFLAEDVDGSDWYIVYKTTLSSTHSVLIDGLTPNTDYLIRISLSKTEGFYGAKSSPVKLSAPQIAVPDPRHHSTSGKLTATNITAIMAPLVCLIVLISIAFVIFYIRHRRLQKSFMSFTSSHYDPRSGQATFGEGSDDFESEDEGPIIRGFSDDEPLVVA